MSSKILTQPTYRKYTINAAPDLPVFKDIISAHIDQVEALLHRHSPIHLIRFDLAFPDNGPWRPDQETDCAGRLFQRLKLRLMSQKNGNPDWVYGWAREHEKAKKGHLHCFVAYPAESHILPGISTPNTKSGMLGIIGELWEKIHDGYARVWLSASHYIDDWDSLNRAIEHISYLSKTRSKVYGKTDGRGHRNWSASRLTLPMFGNTPYPHPDFLRDLTAPSDLSNWYTYPVAMSNSDHAY